MVHQRAGRPCLLALGLVALAGAERLDLRLDLGGGEAMQQGAPPFLLERAQCWLPGARRKGHRGARHFGGTQDVAEGQACAAEWRVLSVGQRRQPPLHRANAEHQHVVVTPLRQRVGKLDERLQRIDRYGIPAIAMHEHRRSRAPLGQLKTRIWLRACLAFADPVAKARDDLRLHCIDVEVADDQEHRALWPVIALVQAYHLSARRRFQHFGLADGHAARGGSARKQEGELLLAAPALEIVAAPPFRQHDTALAVDGRLAERQLARRFAQEEQALVHQRVSSIGQFEHVGREVLPRGGVGVGAEGKAKPLEDPHHLAFGYVARPVERHVLHEMRKALLALGFVERPERDREPDRDCLLRLRIVAQRIAHAIGQHAEPHRRIRRDVARLVRPRPHRRLCEGRSAQCKYNNEQGG